MADLSTIQKAAGRFLALSLPMLSRTMDVRFANCCLPGGEEGLRQNHPARGIYVFWHEHIAALLMQWQQVPMTLLVGRHRDADWVGETARAMGYRLVRGSTSRGATAALRQLQHEAASRALGLTPDGPRGPRRQMSSGPIWLASRLGLPLFCVAVGIKGARRTRTWDQFAIPLPGCRVRTLISPPIQIRRLDSREELEATRISVQRLMDDLHRVAEDWVEGRVAIKGRRPTVVAGKLWDLPAGSSVRNVKARPKAA